MSDAAGTVVKNGRVIAWFEYMGVSDICCARTFPTREALTANWRKLARESPDCECGSRASIVDVVLFSEYGGGGKVCDSTFCETCQTITGDRCAYDLAGEYA